MKFNWRVHGIGAAVAAVILIVAGLASLPTYESVKLDNTVEKVIVDKTLDVRWLNPRWVLIAEDGSWVEVHRGTHKAVEEGETYATDQWRTD